MKYLFQKLDRMTLSDFRRGLEKRNLNRAGYASFTLTFYKGTRDFSFQLNEPALKFMQPISPYVIAVERKN